MDFGILDISGKCLVREIGVRVIDFGKRYIRENSIREMVRQGKINLGKVFEEYGIYFIKYSLNISYNFNFYLILYFFQMHNWPFGEQKRHRPTSAFLHRQVYQRELPLLCNLHVTKVE